MPWWPPPIWMPKPWFGIAIVLTAGSASQTVPDTDNPFPKAIEDALSGQADADGDGRCDAGDNCPTMVAAPMDAWPSRSSASSALRRISPRRTMPH